MTRRFFFALLFAIGLTYGIEHWLPPHPARAQYVPNLNLSTQQVTCAATPTLISPQRAFRGAIIIENTSTTAIYIGPANVSTTTGMLLSGVVGASLTFAVPVGAPFYCVVASGTAVISEAEVF